MPQIMEPEAMLPNGISWMQMVSGRFHTAFPAPFAWLFRLAPIMPHWLYRGPSSAKLGAWTAGGQGNAGDFNDGKWRRSS